MNRSLKTAFSTQIPFFMAMPAVAWHTLFFYIPVGLIIFLSVLKSGTIIQDASFFTLENYTYFFKPLFGMVLLRSLLLALGTSVFCLILSYPVAYFIAFKVRTERVKNLLLFFLILPFWTSLMVQVYSWFFILEHDGLVNMILTKLGLIHTPLHLLNTSFAVYIVMVYCYLPFMIMPIYTILEKIDRRLFEAADDLGATPWQSFMRITIPLSMPGIKTGFFLVFVPAFGELVVPMLMSGGKQLFVGPLIAQYFLAARQPYWGASFTVISCIALLVAVALINWSFNKMMPIRTKAKG
jgi:spermidine/putrescine transport system permease protein